MSPKKLQGPNEPILLIHYLVYEGAKLLFDQLPADIKTSLQTICKMQLLASFVIVSYSVS